MTVPIVLVGEAPGKPEHRDHTPRDQWPISKKVARWFELAGLPQRDASLVPLLNARPTYGPKAPTAGEIDENRLALFAAVAEAAPKVVLAMGKAAHRAFYFENASLFDAMKAEIEGHETTVVICPHPSGRNLQMNDKNVDRLVARAIRASLGDYVSPITAYGDALTWEDVAVWSDPANRPELLAGHVVLMVPSETHLNQLDVLLDGEKLGRVRSGRANPFVHRVKGEPYAWYPSDGQGEYYREPGDAADAMAVRRLTGEPPKMVSDVARWWRWEQRCLGRGREAPRLSGYEEWMKIRGPFTPEHPYTEPISEEWPPCP